MTVKTNTVQLIETSLNNVLTVHVKGKLTRQHYEQFVPEVERLVEKHGKIRVLLELHDFHGWTTGAFWQDIKFDLKHFRDIERLAIVGQSKWQQGMAIFCKPFTTAKIRYFDEHYHEEARQWIEEH